MSLRNRNSWGTAHFRCSAISFILLAFASGSSPARGRQTATETASAFRWIHANSDPQLWEQILKSFSEELTPDRATPAKSAIDTYGYKYLQKVGIFGHSALVIVGQRPAKEVSKGNEWNVYYSAFNLDLSTGQKSSIEHAERLWQWRFVKLARFGPSSAPDVTFTYLSCTECEPDSMFSSFYYDTEKSAWQMRPWGDGKDLWWTAGDGLVVELDLIGDGFFDCVYGILNSQDSGFQNLAMRCKEFTETAAGESKVADNTVIYGISDGQSKARRVTDASEAVRLTEQICKPSMKSFLCRLHGDSSVTAGQTEILKAVFPKAPVTARDLSDFRSLNRTTTISEVVSRCGVPDELSGSGFYIFTYHLGDGSFVHLTAASTDSRILEANHLDDKGYGTSLFAKK
jgi:hypothetical protein